MTNLFLKRHYTDAREKSMSGARKVVLICLYAVVGVVVILTLMYLGSFVMTRTKPVGSFSITTPYAAYLPGEEVTFVITNNFNSTIMFPNDCPDEPLAVYFFEHNAWKRVHAEADKKSCKADRNFEIKSHASLAGTYGNVKQLFATPGKYRIVAYLPAMDSLSYRDISIVAKPVPPEIPALLPPKQFSNSPASRSSNGTSSSSTRSTTPSSPAPSPAPAPTMNTKTVAVNGGSVTLTYSATTIYINSIVPANGCTYEANGMTGSNLEVTFKCNGRETQLQLWISGGTLRQKIE